MADSGKHIVYCAGPMFTASEQATLDLIAQALKRKGFETYQPPINGIEIAKFMSIMKGDLLSIPKLRTALDWIRKMVFAMDMYQLLERCDSLVFCMDGRVPDDGSVSETAAAFAAGRPIVIYKTTPITMLANRDNPMVEGLSYAWQYVTDIEKIPDALTTMINALHSEDGSTGYTYSPSHRVGMVVAAGKAIWEALQFAENQGGRRGPSGAPPAPMREVADMQASVNAFTSRPQWNPTGLDPSDQELARWLIAALQVLNALGPGQEPSPEIATELARQLDAWALSSPKMQGAFYGLSLPV